MSRKVPENSRHADAKSDQSINMSLERSRYGGWRVMIQPKVLLALIACVWLYGVVLQHGREIFMPWFIDYWDTWQFRLVSSHATLWLFMGVVFAAPVAGLFTLIHRFRKGQFHPYSLSSFLVLTLTLQTLTTLTTDRDDGIRSWSKELVSADLAAREANAPPKSNTQWTDPNGRYTVAFPSKPVKREVGGAYAFQVTKTIEGKGVLYALTVTPIAIATGSYEERRFLENANAAFLQSLGVGLSRAKMFPTELVGGGQKLGYTFTSVLNGVNVFSMGFWIIDGDYTVRVSVLYDASLDDANSAFVNIFLSSFELIER